MDSALKQRLLGAAVLIALAIIFVPMFLGNAPPKQDSTTNLNVPAPTERKFETRTLPVEIPSATPTPVPSDSNKVVTVDTHAPARPDARPEDAAAPATVAPVKVEPKASATAEPKVAPAPAAAAPATSAAISTTSAAPGRFSVNLGIYADQAHADALVAKVKKLGQPAYSESTEYQGKSALRVRVGPFADHALAETARLKIKQAEPKVPSSVVESSEQPKADAPTNALPANRAGGWAVQLGAFKLEAEANKLRDRVRGGGVAAFVDRTGTDQPLWRVRAGPYADRAGADTARTSLKQKLQLDGVIVTQP
jgi:DedD protein